ncbi:putative restriction endonuclease [Actinomadura pelletieri DSM 43383]|uniref:Putative restriction endonuclease n=1 Tax=Actinomadura pelletieri DSM 43383 TaxID=1120940 RepID=A0A495QHV7_9ACTN|nr:Uma2 family endonuclease [Actinomadura pelletieri]RKS71723.1 putative restriction endonuclease [Actinomadura pelletieri DSM 43383]
MRERSQNVAETLVFNLDDLSDNTLWDMWVRGEVEDLLDLPYEGIRVEIIGGQIVVSPAPTVAHAVILTDISTAFTTAPSRDRDVPWVPTQVVNLWRETAGKSAIPDLVVLAADVLEAAANADAFGLSPDEVEMVVEVTSPSNSEQDRPPTGGRRLAEPNKWSRYAQVEIPYYLLVDRSPKEAKTTLYCIPDRSTGAYLHRESWEFGETIQLPEPFNVEIETRHWQPWKK